MKYIVKECTKFIMIYLAEQISKKSVIVSYINIINNYFSIKLKLYRLKINECFTSYYLFK